MKYFERIRFVAKTAREENIRLSKSSGRNMRFWWRFWKSQRKLNGVTVKMTSFNQNNAMRTKKRGKFGVAFFEIYFHFNHFLGHPTKDNWLITLVKTLLRVKVKNVGSFLCTFFYQKNCLFLEQKFSIVQILPWNHKKCQNISSTFKMIFHSQTILEFH